MSSFDQDSHVGGSSLPTHHHSHSLGVTVDENGVPHEMRPQDLSADAIIEMAHRAPYGATVESEEDEVAGEKPNEKSLDNGDDGSLSNRSFLSFTMGTHHNMDEEVVRIARQMKGLDEKQFLMLADLTHKRAWKNVFSVVDYRGTNWYLPNMRPIEGDESRFGAGIERRRYILWFSLFGWRIELSMVGYLIRAVMLVALWLALWSAMPKHLVELRGFVFDPILLVLVCTMVGGIISRLFRVPPLVCVLWIAIMWNNIPEVGYLTSGIDPYIRKACLTIGLCVILVRAGLYIKLEELKPIALRVLAFSYVPATAELVSHAFLAKSLFGYPNTTWAFTHGAVAAAISPGVVVPAILTLKLDGMWVTRGPGLLMMPGAPAEMVLAIWNVTFMAGLCINDGHMPTWLTAILGPIQIIGGIVLGIVLGGVHYVALKVFLAEAHKLPTRQYTIEHASRVSYLSTGLLVLLGCATLFYTKALHFYGGGSVAVVLMAMTTSALQRRRSDAPYFEDQFKYLCLHTADLWDHMAMPMLFTMVGSTVDLGQLFNSYFFPRMLACMSVGLAARIITVQLVTIREDYDLGERIVMALGWCGKATVQAAVGRTALDLATEMFDEVAHTQGLTVAQENVKYARLVANAGVLMITICAPICALSLVRLGPKVARKEAIGAH